MPSNAVHLTRLKVAITLLAISGLVLRIAFPNLRIDAVSLGLLAIAILPWLSPLIKSAELPGGLKIEFQDVKAAAERVAAGEPAAASASLQITEPSYLAIAEADPRLALVGLRIEIEKRLRTLAEQVGAVKGRPLTQLIRDLQERGVISPESIGGLLDLIKLGNQAAHGVPMESDAAYSAVEYGPRVLGILDAKLAEYRSGAA